MDLQRFEEFTAIVKYKSIKDAAHHLGIRPSTLSSRLNSFEQSLGAPLFDRSSNVLTLTDAGQRLYKDAQKISLRYSVLKQNLQEYDKFTKYKNIRIGVAGDGLPFYLGPFLDLINNRQPDLQLELVNENVYSIQEGLLHNELDLYFAPVMAQVHYDGIMRCPLYGSDQYIILPTSHRLSSKNVISIKELNQETFLLHPICAENCIRDFQLENLKAAGIHYSTYETTSSTSLYKLLVPVGKGILFLPSKQLENLPNCITIPLTNIAYPAPSSLFYRKNDIRPEVQQFINEFIHFVKEASSHDHRTTV